MQIDWITVTAQIANFLILVWLLKRFLYRPVIDAMARREQRIAGRLRDATEREEKADAVVARYQASRAELAERRDELIAEARAEAEAEKRRLVEEARTAVTETRAGWQQQVHQEQVEFLDQLRLRAAESIEAIARKALRDLADAELEEQVVRTFLARMADLDRGTRKALADGGGPVQIAGSFELDAATRSRLTRTVHELIAPDVDVDYRRAPELLCGLELRCGGRQLSWSLASYMDELRDRIGEAFTQVAPRG